MALASLWGGGEGQRRWKWRSCWPGERDVGKRGNLVAGEFKVFGHGITERIPKGIFVFSCSWAQYLARRTKPE